MQLLWALALASEPIDFEAVRTVDGCAIAMRPEDHLDKAALRATCHWPEADVAALTALVSDLGRYIEFVPAIVESEVRRREGDRSLVYQRQHLWPIADREVLLWVQKTVDGPRTTVSWTVAGEETLDLRDGSIRVPRSDGFWQVGPHPEGGAAVVHQIAMDAGGRLPRWLVDMVRTRGFAQVTSDVRELVQPGDASEMR